MDTPMFDFFIKEEAVATAQKIIHEDEEEVKNHRKILKICWPDWDGPLVDYESIDGYCEVGKPIVHSITDEKNLYCYMAPCRITSISDDGLEVIAEIAYEENSTCYHMNGNQLKLHITEVWAPVAMINRSYRHAIC